MKGRVLVSAVLVFLLFGCEQQQQAAQQERTIGGDLGDSYKSMLDEAKKGVESANEQIQSTEQAVRERD